MPAEKPERIFTGEYDKRGEPIHEGDLLYHGFLSFMVVEPVHHVTETGDIETRYNIPEGCVVVRKATNI